MSQANAQSTETDILPAESIIPIERIPTIIIPVPSLFIGTYETPIWTSNNVFLANQIYMFTGYVLAGCRINTLDRTNTYIDLQSSPDKVDWTTEQSTIFLQGNFEIQYDATQFGGYYADLTLTKIPTLTKFYRLSLRYTMAQQLGVSFTCYNLMIAKLTT